MRAIFKFGRNIFADFSWLGRLMTLFCVYIVDTLVSDGMVVARVDMFRWRWCGGMLRVYGVLRVLRGCLEAWDGVWGSAEGGA